MNNYNFLKIGDISKVFAGGDKPKVFSKTKNNFCSIPVYSNGEMKNGLQGYSNIPKVNSPCLTVSARGSIGYVCVRNEPFIPIVRLITIIPDLKKINLSYLYYYLLLYRQSSIGSVQTQLTVPDISTRKIYLPSIEDQEKSIKILELIDEKIRLNNQINSKLEPMAKLIYDYWFAQFDFPDKEGRPYKSSGGKMVYNEELKRDVPNGWEVKEIGEISIIKAGGDKPNKISNARDENYNIPIYSNGVENDGLYGYTTLPKITDPSITVSARGTIGFTALRFEPFVPIVRLICITPKDKEYLNFLYQSISMMCFFDSGSSQKQLTVPMIDTLKIVIPKKELLVRFNKLTDIYFDKIRVNKNENKMLTQLRNWLLPMLINGQAKVS